jgi:CRISPR/Cas system-associated protein Cas10 (large subunit of type III CRISPR-Cas system)
MARWGIDNVEEGLERSAILYNSNLEAFKKAVNNEAERRYRSRHFTELNKALKTRYDSQQNQIFYSVKRKFCITYPCSICGRPIELQPDGKDIPIIRNYLNSAGWAHSTCINK